MSQPWRFWIWAVLLLLSIPNLWAESRYIRKTAGSRRVMVFVHGVLGDSTSTWTNTTANTYWPRLISEDKDYDGVDLFVVDYPSPKTGVSLGIDELAESLRLTLDANAVTSYPELIFVSHSMGGLVTRAYLMKYRESAKAVKMMYFFATPTTGASVASIAKVVSGNPQFSKMSPMTSDAYLADLQRTWLASPQLTALPSFCAYEVRPTFGVKIVEQQSASNLCNRPLDPIDRNHIDIVKPASTTDPMYAALKAAYRSVMIVSAQAANPTRVKETPLVTATRARVLRMETEGLKQVRTLIGEQPKLNGKPVYCDSVVLSLVLAHTQSANTPIQVNSITVHSEALKDTGSLKPGACEVDRLSSHPHGIRDIDTVVLTAEDDGVRAKYIKTATSAFEVNPNNILDLPSTSRSVTLRPGEEPFGLRIIVEDNANVPQRIWFSVDYDANGPQTTISEPLLIWR